MPYDIIIGRTPSEIKELGKEGLIYIGKSYVKMGPTTSLTNKILMDVARSHVVLVAGKRGCLAGDTLVFTDKGYKLIKEFDQKNDKVLSFDKETKNFEWENAELLHYAIKNEKLFKITLSNKKELIATKEHPFLIFKDKKFIWKKTSKLTKFDFLIGRKLNKIKIKDIKKIDGINEVYDLTVLKNHSFIANGIISSNSGKSYTLGVIAEEMAGLPQDIAENIAILIYDTMGIFWTMAYPNEKEGELLRSWNLEARKLPVRIFVPFGYADEYAKKGIPVTKSFALKVSELAADDWIMTFGLNFLDPAAIEIQKTVANLLQDLKEKGKEFDLDDIILAVKCDAQASETVKNAAVNLFEGARTWGLFAAKGQAGTEIKEVIEGGKTSIIDLSAYSSIGTFNVRALVIGLLSKKLFNERMQERKYEEVQSVRHGLEYSRYLEKREMPLVWLFLDEGHEFLPKEGKTAATDVLIQILREGRQPGISMALATQQPGKIHSDVMTQADIVLSHRVTAKQDIEALNMIMQTYLLESITQHMNELPKSKGSAIILDDNSERIYPMRVRARYTWHGGEAPTAVKAKERI